MIAPRVLVTFPGKLGDLVYSLPAVSALAARLGAPVTYQTSPLCRAALPLLKNHPAVAQAMLDETWTLEHTRYGCQPWRFREPTGFDAVYHLGFRPEILGGSIMTRHLIETFFIILNQGYGLDLAVDPDSPYLFLDAGPPEEYVVFQGYGETLMDHLSADDQQRLARFWSELLKRLDREVVIVSGAGERDFYRFLDREVVCPPDLWETARIIRRARCFLGVGSAAAAIANGFKTPRLVFQWFRTDPPTGPNGLTFSLDADPAEVAAGLKNIFGI